MGDGAPGITTGGWRWPMRGQGARCNGRELA
jgi:hypothetical protein